MLTTRHIPDALLKSVDHRVRARRESQSDHRPGPGVRGQEQTTWDPAFLERLRNVDPEAVTAVDDMVRHLRRSRRSQRPLGER
jgi:hypothetical protein